MDLTASLLQARLIYPELVLSTCMAARGLDGYLHNQDPSHYHAACRHGSKNKVLCISQSSLVLMQAKAPSQAMLTLMNKPELGQVLWNGLVSFTYFFLLRSLSPYKYALVGLRQQ